MKRDFLKNSAWFIIIGLILLIFLYYVVITLIRKSVIFLNPNFV